MTEKFDRDYYGLPARAAGVHCGYGLAPLDRDRCLGRVLAVKLPGDRAVALVCQRCHKTTFDPGWGRDRWDDRYRRPEVVTDGSTCPECGGRRGWERERGDGAIVGFDGCEMCYATGRIELRRNSDIISELAKLR